MLSLVKIECSMRVYTLIEHRTELKLSCHLPNCTMSDLFRDFYLAFLSLIKSETSEKASRYIVCNIMFV